jgi:hypothetical protein
MAEPINQPLMKDITTNSGGTVTIGNKVYVLNSVNKQKDEGNTSASGKFHIVWHWTAGTDASLYDDYHFNISVDVTKTKAVAFKTLQFSEKGQHLWQRNTGAIGFSFCALSTNAENKPTPVMVDAGVILTAEVCAWKGIDPRGTILLPEKKYTRSSDSMANTGRDVAFPTIADHATFARKDGYYPDRVDIDTLLPVLVKRAQEHFDLLKQGKTQFRYLPIIK